MARPARTLVLGARASRRERWTCCGCSADGLSDAEIAAELVIGHEGVNTYVSRIPTELDLRDQVQPVVWACRTDVARWRGHDEGRRP